MLQIASWQYGKEKIRLTAPPVRKIREHYTDNEEWRLLSVRVNNSDYHHEGIVVGKHDDSYDIVAFAFKKIRAV